MNWEILFTHQYKGIKGQQGFGVLNIAHESNQQLMVFQNPDPLMALTLLEDTVALPFLEAVQQIRPCLWVYVNPNTSRQNSSKCIEKVYHTWMVWVISLVLMFQLQ